MMIERHPKAMTAKARTAITAAARFTSMRTGRGQKQSTQDVGSAGARKMEDSGLEKKLQVEGHPAQYSTYTTEGTKTQRGSVTCVRAQSKAGTEPGFEGDGGY